MKRAMICVTLVSLMLTFVLSAAAQDGDSDTLLDTDKDGLTDVEEKEIGTDPNNPDTGGDGVPDGVEVYLHGLFALHFTPDGSAIVATDNDTIFVYDTQTATQQHSIAVDPAGVTGFFSTPDGSMIVAPGGLGGEKPDSLLRCSDL